MGNKILKGVSIDKDPVAQGIELRWKCYPATNTTSNEPLTAFLFEKKRVDGYQKALKTAIIESVRKEAQNLQRLRHPSILHVMEALVEESGTFAFATKQIRTNLASLLDKDPLSLSNLEMKCGLLDVAEGLSFLHNDAKTAHLGLSPTTIFVTPTGKWLLGGFAYCVQGVEKGFQRDCDHLLFNGGSDLSQLSPDPSLRYCAPELTSGFPGKCGMESDIFSLGLIAFEVMSTDRKPFLNGLARGDRNAHGSKIKQLLPFKEFQKIPNDLAAIIPSLLQETPTSRADINIFLQSDFFQDIHIKAIRFLDQLQEKDDHQKLAFLKGFSKLLEDPSNSICHKKIVRERIIPHLSKNLCKSPALYSAALDNLLTCLKMKECCDPELFQSQVWPYLRNLFSAKEISIDAVSSLMRHADLFTENAEQADSQAILVPFVLRCLELHEPNILQTTLEKIPVLHKSFDYQQIKCQILPRMLSLLFNTKTTSLKIRVQILLGVQQMFQIFDKTTITDTLLVACERVQKMDKSPAICMCLLSCYDAMSQFLGPKLTAEKILPLIIPMLVEDSLSKEQYVTQITVTKKLLQRIETTREKELMIQDARKKEATAALDNSADNGLASLGNDIGASSTTASKTSTGGGPAPKRHTTADAHQAADMSFLAELGGNAPKKGDDLFAGVNGSSAPPPNVNKPDPFAAAPPKQADPFANVGVMAPPKPEVDPFAGMIVGGSKPSTADPFAGMNNSAPVSSDPFAGMNMMTGADPMRNTTASVDAFNNVSSRNTNFNNNDPFAGMNMTNNDPFAGMGNGTSNSFGGNNAFGGTNNFGTNSAAADPFAAFNSGMGDKPPDSSQVGIRNISGDPFAGL